MGDNSFGQLGIGNNELSFSSLPTIIKGLSGVKLIRAGHHSLALTQTGALYFWGSGVFGTLYDPHIVIESSIVDASVGGCFGSALDQDGGVWVWGSNSHGELGLGRE